MGIIVAETFSLEPRERVALAGLEVQRGLHLHVLHQFPNLFQRSLDLDDVS